MKTVDQQMEDFKKLSLQEKKEIVFKMFDELKDINDNFKYVYENLPTIEITDILMESLYRDLAELAEEKRSAIKSIEWNKIEKMNNRIKEIQRLEKEASAKDDPEQILNAIIG